MVPLRILACYIVVQGHASEEACAAKKDVPLKGNALLQTGARLGSPTQRMDERGADGGDDAPPTVSQEFQWHAPVGNGPSGEGAVNDDEYLSQVLQESPVLAPHAKEYAPSAGEETQLTMAKGKALEGVCALLRDRDHLLKAFDETDVNGDGKLSSVDEIHASGGGEKGQHEVFVDKTMWLNLTLPRPSMFCDKALPSELCEGLRGWRQRIAEGASAPDFLEICENEDALEPNKSHASPQQVVVLPDPSGSGNGSVGGDGGDVGDVGAAGPEALVGTMESEALDEPVNASLVALAAARLSPREKRAGDQIAWASHLKGMNKLMVADYCWRDVWARGAAERVCKDGYYRGSSGLDVGFCYQYCPAGYHRFGDHCWQNEPPGFNDVGGYFQREWWENCCTNIWPFGRTCIRCLKVETRSKSVRHSPGCSIVDHGCSTCPSGHYGWGALCYKHEKPGYTCYNADLTCKRNCFGDLPVGAPDACCSDTAACVANTVEIVAAVVEAAASTVAFAATFGASAVATATAKASKEALEAAAKKNMKRVAIRISKESFRKHLRETRKQIIRDAVKDNMKNKILDKRSELLIAWSMDRSESLAQAYEKKAEKAAEDPRLTVIKDVDPIGLAKAIDGSHGSSQDSVNTQVANWMDVLSVFDPTGIMSAVASIIKHNHCESTQAKMDEIASQKMLVPELEKDCGDVIALSSGKHGFLMGTWTLTTHVRVGKPVWQQGTRNRYIYRCSTSGRWVVGPDFNHCSLWMEAKSSELCPHMSDWKSYVHPNWVEDPNVVFEEQ